MTVIGGQASSIVRLCMECSRAPATYLADLGDRAPAWPGQTYALCEQCAADLRAEKFLDSIRSMRPDEVRIL